MCVYILDVTLLISFAKLMNLFYKWFFIAMN